MQLGVYIQVPFCQTKCTYCNFHTGVVSAARFQPYVEAVAREIRGHRMLYEEAGLVRPEALANAVVDTLYIGGGTPSLLDPSELQRLVEAVGETFTTKLREVTLEADPETIEEAKARAWARAGINRISFGLQSFSDRELTAVGRMHRRADVFRAVPILREAGIANISFDLIAGLPHQTGESWGAGIAELLALAPEHVSIYMLEIDEGSRLGKEILSDGTRYSAAAVPGDDAVVEYYEFACGALAAAGYHHYEISNWAKPGLESLHNLKYWRREAYLGFGAGAHSFSGTERWGNEPDAAAYVRAMDAGRLPVAERETLTSERALEEELFLGLRQLDGIDLGQLEARYGVQLANRFERLAAGGFIEQDGPVVRLAPARLSVSNEVFVELLR